MKVLKPVTISAIGATNAVETVALYNAGTSYAVGTRCRLAATNKIYESAQTPNTGHSPDTSPLYWAEVSPTNQWAMFDGAVDTQTTYTLTAGLAPLSVSVSPGYVDGIALFDVAGTTLTVTVKDGPGGATVYTNTQTLDDAEVADWYAYFVEPINPRGDIVLTDLPAYANAYVTVAVGASAIGDVVAIGGVFYGRLDDLGEVQLGASAGIIDYSRKETNAYGTTSLVQRRYSKRLSCVLMLDNADINRVHRILTALRATACVWVGSETYTPALVMGFYRDFSVDIAYTSRSLCNLEIEGLA